MATPLTLTTPKRGPRSRSWYEACVRHALRNYGRPHALRRNPLNAIANDLPQCSAVNRTSDVAALRSILANAVQSVIDRAHETDRQQLSTVLHGVMRGRDPGNCRGTIDGPRMAS